MKVRFRLITVFVLLIVGLASVLSGCSEGGKSGQLYIKYYTGGYGEEWIKEIVKQFEEETGATVELDGANDMTFQARTILEAGRDIPDILMVQYSNYREYVQKGWVEPIDDLYKEKIYEGKSLEQIIEPGLADYGKFRKNIKEDEHYWIIPWTAPTTGIVYNVKMLEEVGYDKPPKTEAELKDLCQKLVAAGKIPFTWGGMEIGYWNFPVMGWWAQYEGIDKWNEFWNFPNAEVYMQQGRIEALRLWQDLLVDSATGGWINSIDKPTGLDHMGAFRSFVQGKAAMVPGGAWIENEIEDFVGSGFEMRMMNLPSINGAKETDILNTEAGDFMLIPSAATNKDLAKEFLRIMHRKENMIHFSKTVGVPRPFTNYKHSEIEGVSEFKKSTFELYDNSQKLFRNSRSPMLAYLSLNEWQGKGADGVYVGLQGTDRMTPKEMVEMIYKENVQPNWKRWRLSLGLED